MVLFEGTLEVGIVLLAAVALAEISKTKQKYEKGFDWMAISGALFIFSNVFSLPAVFSVTAQANTYLMQLFLGLGKIAVLVAAGYMAVELFGIKKRK